MPVKYVEALVFERLTLSCLMLLSAHFARRSARCLLLVAIDDKKTEKPRPSKRTAALLTNTFVYSNQYFVLT